MKKVIASLVAASFIALSGCAVEDTTSDGSGSASDTSDATGGGSSTNYTVAQQSAITAAKQYLSMGSGFSRAGLIDQLSSKAGNGFKRKNAVFAVNHVKVNWNQQAVLAAKGYMSMGGFSRSGLIQQLESSAGNKFTHAQAVFAANKIGL